MTCRFGSPVSEHSKERVASMATIVGKTNQTTDHTTDSTTRCSSGPECDIVCWCGVPWIDGMTGQKLDVAW